MRNRQYPMTILDLSKKVVDLVGSEKKLNYFLNFKLKGTVEKSESEIQDKMQLISCECTKHNYNFQTPVRALINTSSTYSKVTCPYCMRDAKEIEFQTWEDIVLWIKNSSWPFEVADESQFDKNIIFNQKFGGLPTKTKITLCCTKNRIDSDKPCVQIVDHSYSNIKYSINEDNDFLLCQGPCDSKKKGKTSRKTLLELQAQLKEAREATWEFDLNHPFTKATGNNWFRHQCGNSIYRNFYKLIKFSIENDLPNDTDQDCPFCSGHTVYHSVNNDVNKYAKWVNIVSNGCITLISKTMPPSPDKLELECKICKTNFIGSERGIKQNVRCGCPKCTKEKIHSQRAWDYEEAKQLVSKRGYVLLSDPGDYISITEMLTPEGNTIESLSILDLLQQIPGSTIDNEICNPVNSLRNAGKPYSQEDEIKFRKLLAEQSHTFKEIASLMERTAGSIKTKTRRLGLRNDDREHINRIFSLKDNAFNIINKESAFFAGLFAADGCFDRRINRNALSIELKAIDEDLLLRLMKFIGLENDLKYRTIKNTGGRGIYAAINFTSSEIVLDLKRYFNVDENKTYELSPINFDSDEASWGFLAGFLAGDGHVRINRKTNEPKLSFVSASSECANWLEIILKKEVNSVSKTEQTVKKVIHYYVSVTGKKAVKIASILQNYDFGMDRKWRILREMALMKIK